MNDKELLPHLFRTEYSRITAVLCKHFGFDELEVAEDIASETFLTALQTWPYQGIPENPVAWLYAVSKNKAINVVNRKRKFQTDITTTLLENIPGHDHIIDLTDDNIQDSQLRMLFSLCHPSVPLEAQIGLSLRILCGFGIDEIANAFLTNKETINKRLFRAKEKLREEKIQLEFPTDTELHSRLHTVLTTIYLIFNEGYYSETQHSVIREDLCFEAMRLAHLLTLTPKTNIPEVNALLALMCFHSSRLKARVDKSGAMVLYENQNEDLWDRELVARGTEYLHLSSGGPSVSKYHIEASIAYWHTVKQNSIEKWENILNLYNHLLVIEYSPIAALNRTFALSKVKGKQVAIQEAEKLQLHDNHFYFTLLGELYHDIDETKAKEHFAKALSLAKTNADKVTINQKITALM